MSHTQDLITAFERIGLTITVEDIPTILRIGADKYLNNVRHHVSEESMSGIYIILTEMRENGTTKLQSAV